MRSVLSSTRAALRPLRDRIRQHLPGRLRAVAPVVQAYLGGEYESRYTLVNFPSLYAPRMAKPCRYEIALHAADGTRLGRRVLRIPAFGSAEIRPAELFGPDLPPLGMFSARIRPANALSLGYKHLGLVTSHFYALFSDRAHRSLALVHPQTLVNAPSGENQRWQSGFLLDAGRIRRLIAIQINPTARAVRTSLYLVRATAPDEILARRDGEIVPMGARRVEWNLPEAGLGEGMFFVAAEGLPTNNAKPILLTYFADGSFTGMHA